MDMRVTASGFYEPTLTHQLLRGCACGSPHPIALRSPDPSTCPKCGVPAQPPSAPVTERAVLTGRDWRMLAGRFSLWMGRVLARLAGRI